jgi:antitoxin VapB
VLITPLVTFDSITLDECNRCLVAWQHKMGPWTRPPFKTWLHGLRHNGELVAVLAATTLITPQAGGFTRDEAIELGRVCAGRPHTNTVALRLWREFVFPEICRANGYRWAISYQDRKLHTGGLYKWDGWVWLGKSSSGTDPRGGVVKGRSKNIWGWCADGEERATVAKARAPDLRRAA